MKWVEATNVSRTGFEQLMLREFGVNLDVSESTTLTAIGAAIVLTVLFKTSFANLSRR